MSALTWGPITSPVPPESPEGMSTETTAESKTSVPSLTVDDLERLAERVDNAYAEVQTLEPDARAKAMTLKSTIEEFHKVGLTHIVKTFTVVRYI